MSFKERLGRALLRADAQDMAVIEELCQQRAELLEALKAAKKKGSRWHPADPVVQQINAAITRAEAAE